jgi:serine/threonine protein kinase
MVMRARHLSYSEVSRIGVQIAEALVRGHASGAPHGAITPNSILVSEDGRARLIAQQNRRAPDAYLSPEQVRGEPVGPQTDVYALGLVLLEAATGRQAYPGEGPEAARARLYQPPEVPNDVPTGLARALLAMTETAPEARPSAERTADLLSNRSPSPPATAPAGPETAPATASALGGMSAGRMAAIGLPVLALVVIIGILLFANSGDDETAGKQAAGASSSASATSTPDDSDGTTGSGSPSESNSASDETTSARPTGSASKPSHSKIALPSELSDIPKLAAPKLPTSEDVSSSVSEKVHKAWNDFTDWLGSFVK